jgi:hypothetical protein
MMEEFGKAWERVGTRWWDDALRHPQILESNGSKLNAMSGFKERWDRALEQMWSGWRLPSALDVERVYERLGEVEERVARLEETLAPASSAAETKSDA